MLRIALFLGTNIAIMVLISNVFQLFGFQGLLAANGVDLNLQALLVFSALIGFVGSCISLLLSKTMAKRGMGVQLIQQPRTEFESWLVQTVKRQADKCRIGMPEVGIFKQDAPNAFATGWNRNNALVAVSTGHVLQPPAPGQAHRGTGANGLNLLCLPAQARFISDLIKGSLDLFVLFVLLDG